MEREISSAVEIGVGLIAISAVIAIIWFTVYLGNTIKVDSVNEANRILSEVESGLLTEQIGKAESIPTATAYGILRTHSHLIPEFICTVPGCPSNAQVQDLTRVTPCVLNHLTGRVILNVELIQDSWFKVTLIED